MCVRAVACAGKGLVLVRAHTLTNRTCASTCNTQFGSKLQAAMVRKLRESDVTTRWMLTYNLHNKLRMQFSLSSSPPYAKQLLFQYSSEGS